MKPRTSSKKAAAAKPTTSEAVHQAAAEFLKLRDEHARVGVLVEKLKAFLKDALPEMPGQEMAVGDEAVHLQHKETRSFDWDRAKGLLPIAALEELLPFTKKTESLDLKAAERLLNLEKFKEFIVTQKTVSLCVRELEKD